MALLAEEATDTLPRVVKKSPADQQIRYLAAHTEYQAAIFITEGQYLLCTRTGKNELSVKGISSQILRLAFVGEPVDSDWLPSGIVRCGSGPDGPFFVKFIPAGVQQLFLATTDPATPTMVALPLPPLIFAGCHMTYFVWALRESTCNPKSVLYNAPFSNVYPDGRVCFGQNRPPAVSAKTFEAAWQLFLDAPFNADLCHNKSAAFPQNVHLQLKAVATNKGIETYPVHDLIAYQPGYADGPRGARTLQDVTDYYFLKKEKR